MSDRESPTATRTCLNVLVSLTLIRPMPADVKACIRDSGALSAVTTTLQALQLPVLAQEAAILTELAFAAVRPLVDKQFEHAKHAVIQCGAAVVAVLQGDVVSFHISSLIKLDFHSARYSRCRRDRLD